MTQRSQQADRVLDLAWEEADRFGHRYLGPEHLVLGVLGDGGSGASRALEAHGVDLPVGRAALRQVVTDIQTPWPRCMNNRWTRQLHASVGLPEGYRGAAGPLLGAIGVDLDQLGGALLAELGAGVP